MFLKHEHLWLPVTCKARPWHPTNASPVIVWNNLVWNPWRERFEDIGDASYDEIFASLGVNQLVGFGAVSGGALTPVTRDYDSGSGTETSPTGDGFCVVESVGGGGGGGCRAAAGGGGGGGGGAYCADSSRAVSTGASCSYSVGAAGAGDTNSTATNNGTNGGTSTVNTGAGGFSGIAHSASGGQAASNSVGGSEGTASGGTNTNSSGSAGTDGPSGPGGGAGGTIGTGSRGNGGTGGDAAGSVGAAGIAGRIRFAYTA